MYLKNECLVPEVMKKSFESPNWNKGYVLNII